VSRRTYYRWLPRWQASGPAGLVDRSSRPRRSPQRVSIATERQVAGLREATGFGPDRIGALLDLPPSTCHRILGRLGYLARVRVSEPVVRYEIAEPGGLLHLDTKKLGRIGAGPGPSGDRGSDQPAPGDRLGDPPCRDRCGHPARVRRAAAR